MFLSSWCWRWTPTPATVTMSRRLCLVTFRRESSWLIRHVGSGNGGVSTCHVLTRTFSFPLGFEPTKAGCDNNIKLGTLPVRSGMSWLTLSRTIPTAIFTMLASYALWESHASYKRRQRLRQIVGSIFFVSRTPSNHEAIMTSFPAVLKLGESLEIIVR